MNYSAELNVNGRKAYVGGSDVDDLVAGVVACLEAMEPTVDTEMDLFDEMMSAIFGM